jgi:hypothetical protein
MMSLVDSHRDRVLATLPPQQREHAKHVLEWLVDDDDQLSALSSLAVLHFVWYSLPVKWAVDDTELVETAEATAALMDALDRPRVAQLIRSPRTAEIHQAWQRDDRTAPDRFAKAMADTGYAPLDTDLLTWSSVMGMDEYTAHRQVAAVLERAIVTGAVAPSRTGWRRTATNLTEAWLTTSALAWRGRQPIDAIHSERREAWLRSRTPAHRELLEAILRQVDAPQLIPDQLAAPLRWLLDRIGTGLNLTQAEYLPTSLVAEAKTLWYGDWVLPGFATRSESDLPPLMILRDFAHDTKMITKRQRRLTLTKTSTAALADPDRWWRHVVAGWFTGNDFTVEVVELAAAMMLTEANTNQIVDAATEFVAPRYRVTNGHTPPDRRDVEHALWNWLRPGNSLGFINYDHTLTGHKTLTEAGRAAAITGLQHRSHAPRNRPG